MLELLAVIILVALGYRFRKPAIKWLTEPYSTSVAPYREPMPILPEHVWEDEEGEKELSPATTKGQGKTKKRAPGARRKKVLVAPKEEQITTGPTKDLNEYIEKVKMTRGEYYRRMSKVHKIDPELAETMLDLSV